MFGNQIEANGSRNSRTICVAGSSPPQRLRKASSGHTTSSPQTRPARRQSPPSELDGGAANGEDHGAHRHRDGKLERDRAGGVVHQRLTPQDAHDFFFRYPPFPTIPESATASVGDRHGRQRERRDQRECPAQSSRSESRCRPPSRPPAPAPGRGSAPVLTIRGLAFSSRRRTAAADKQDQKQL